MLKRTPLYEIHQRLGAMFIPFGGWEMPLRYKSEKAEHEAVRQSVGLFDLSHMGEFLVRGPKAGEYLQRLLTQDITRLTPGRAQYTFLLHPQGGILDDLIVYQLEPELYMLVVNAATTEKDLNWLREHLPAAGVVLEDITQETVLLALSGPRSTEILASLTSLPIKEMPYYTARKGEVAGIPDVIVATTGYTGEWTYELFVQKDSGPKLWEALLDAEAAVTPAGLSARNTLRLEMGYLLYGTDIDESTTPLQAGAGWAVKLDKGDFIGREALLKQKEQGLPSRLYGLISPSAKYIPRNGMPLQDEAGNSIGRITSGSISPSLNVGIALAYLPPTYKPEDKVYMEVRGERGALTVVRPPFVKETSLSLRQKSRTT